MSNAPLAIGMKVWRGYRAKSAINRTPRQKVCHKQDGSPRYRNRSGVICTFREKLNDRQPCAPYQGGGLVVQSRAAN